MDWNCPTIREVGAPSEDCRALHQLNIREYQGLETAQVMRCPAARHAVLLSLRQYAVRGGI